MKNKNWTLHRAMKTLGVKAIPFDPSQLGEARAYSNTRREIAIQPGERYPDFVGVHELAHIVLGHTKDNSDLAFLMYKLDPRQKESEAHAVALTVAIINGIDLDVEREMRYLAHFSEGIEVPVAKTAKKIEDAVRIITAAGME